MCKSGTAATQAAPPSDGRAGSQAHVRGSSVTDADELILAQLERQTSKLSELVDRVTALEEKTDRSTRSRRPRPDPNTVYAVPVDDAPYLGAKHAKVTIVQAFEFACPFCRTVRPTLKALLKRYDGDLKIVSRHYVVHPRIATAAALGSCAAGRQGKFELMAELIWTHTVPWTGSTRSFDRANSLSRENIERLAKRAGLGMQRFRSDVDGPCRDTIAGDRAIMARVGVSGTPAFFINGRFLSGARPIEHFQVIIDEELEKANHHIAAGVPLEDYYHRFVMQPGKPKL